MSDCSLINVWGFFCLFVLLFGLLGGGGGGVCVCAKKHFPKKAEKVVRDFVYWFSLGLSTWLQSLISEKKYYLVQLPSLEKTIDFP